MEEKVRAVLEELHAPYELIEIDAEFADTADFCARYGHELDACGNTIIVASKKPVGRFSACVIKGSDRLDVNKTVRKLMGASKASFASPEETMALTGMEIGGVTPFSLPGGVPIFIDAKLMTLDSVILGSGSRSSKVRVSPAILERLPDARIVVGLSQAPKAS